MWLAIQDDPRLAGEKDESIQTKAFSTDLSI
jgi:hypothetical protein